MDTGVQEIHLTVAVFGLRQFAAIQANSAIDGMPALFTGSSFEYAFKGNADSTPAGAHHPGADPSGPVDVAVGNNQLDGLPEQKFSSGFDKDTAATYIFNDTFVLLILIIEKYRFL
jgi:hypothetical protein